MSTTNFARGNSMFPSLPVYGLGAGIRTPFGTLIPPGVKVTYVRSTGPQDGDEQDIAQRLYSTLNSALAECRSGMGDIVFVLPGHAENVSSADQMSNLVAGTRIIGLGRGNSRPTFTWTAATSTFLLDVANVELDNLILNLEPGTGTTTVAAPITVSGAGCAIRNCKIRVGTDANAKVTIAITTTAAADDFEFTGNEVYGATAAECTTVIQFVGADRLKFHGNSIVAATSATGVGVVRFLTTASTDIKMFGNSVRNNKALSTIAITGMAGISGEVDGLFMTVLSDNVAALTGAFATPASIVFGRQVYVANVIAERAALFGTESA
jgi:hypothetical protein